MNQTADNQLLIASVTPLNLERGVLWFSQNQEKIIRARSSNPWWQQNTLLAEKDLVVKPSEFARKLLDLGYERAQSVHGKGVFAVRGGIIEIWPINTATPYLIEFRGNTIESISERKESVEKILPRRLHANQIEKLSPGSFVVHEDHGIGIFRGITITAKNEIPNYYLIEYAAARIGGLPDTLLVPTDQKDRLTPYVGFETPKIHRLGGTLWHNTKRKVREDVEKLARELLALYSKRSTARRTAYEEDRSLEEKLRQSFVFEETPDQKLAEKEIMKDLERQEPMDRVLAGEVGFGKTEIALRAILRVAQNSKQAAVLVPTTILANQHYKTFCERFAELPLKIAMFSRLTPAREEKNILKDLAEGKIDCVIGTHRLLSKNVRFKDLGLAVIDEEQRFGVKQKERFKEMRTEIDILSLSATPIPRTLQLALAGLRAISILKTPPPERLAIQTYTLPYSQKAIKQAIEQELSRRGQIYFLHNRIETIGNVKKMLESLKLSKNPKIEIIHGRMPEKQLILTMEKFSRHQADILLATTIIENGLDISNANTLIVDDAARLGLAEAHQLRGRIGRSNRQAFAYFLYRKNLTEKAGERLEALQEYSGLGDGYQIALRDLEIRGAGNILGSEQSGAINRVGLNLYCQMLSEAVEFAKSDSFGLE